MLNKLITKIIGSRNDRLVKKMSRSIQQINDLEPTMQALSDEELRAKYDRGEEVFENQGGGGGGRHHMDPFQFFNQQFQGGGGGRRHHQGGGGNFHVRFH